MKWIERYAAPSYLFIDDANLIEARVSQLAPGSKWTWWVGIYQRSAGGRTRLSGVACELKNGLSGRADTAEEARAAVKAWLVEEGRGDVVLR